MIVEFILYFSGEDGVIIGIINEYADLLFKYINRYAVKHNLDPIDLPNFKKVVSKLYFYCYNLKKNSLENVLRY